MYSDGVGVALPNWWRCWYFSLFIFGICQGFLVFASLAVGFLSKKDDTCQYSVSKFSAE